MSDFNPQDMIDHKIEVLRQDFQQALQAMIKDTANTIVRMANNMAKDLDKIDARLKKIEESTGTGPRVRTDKGGHEL